MLSFVPTNNAKELTSQCLYVHVWRGEGGRGREGEEGGEGEGEEGKNLKSRESIQMGNTSSHT